MKNMTSAFTARSAARAALDEINAKRRALLEQEETAHLKYLSEIKQTISVLGSKSNPITALDIAHRLASDPEEVNAIAASVGSMGYNAYMANCKYGGVYRPAIPELRRLTIRNRRQFAEVDEDGNLVENGKVIVHESTKYGYYIEK